VEEGKILVLVNNRDNIDNNLDNNEEEIPLDVEPVTSEAGYNIKDRNPALSNKF
jgi:hypothetical protein